MSVVNEIYQLGLSATVPYFSLTPKKASPAYPSAEELKYLVKLSKLSTLKNFANF